MFKAEAGERQLTPREQVVIVCQVARGGAGAALEAGLEAAHEGGMPLSEQAAVRTYHKIERAVRQDSRPPAVQAKAVVGSTLSPLTARNASRGGGGAHMTTVTTPRPLSQVNQ